MQGVAEASHTWEENTLLCTDRLLEETIVCRKERFVRCYMMWLFETLLIGGLGTKITIAILKSIMKISSQENERGAIILYEHSRGSRIISKDDYFRHSHRVQSSEDGPSDLIKIVLDKTAINSFSSV